MRASWPHDVNCHKESDSIVLKNILCRSSYAVSQVTGTGLYMRLNSRTAKESKEGWLFWQNRCRCLPSFPFRVSLNTVEKQAAAMITNDRQQEKESMAEFIAKKREMFLVQMSLDTKREEIRKLEEKARMKEEALRKSEQARHKQDT